MHGTDLRKFERIDPEEAGRRAEAVLFASAEPVPLSVLSGVMPGCDPLEVLAALELRYRDRGINLRRMGDAYAFRTAPGLKFERPPQPEPKKLSKAAMETLAIVAYRPGSTRAEIEEIRGVTDSVGTLDLLMELDLLKFGRRKRTPGRPVTYVTTRHFLDGFGLEALSDLPGLAKMQTEGFLGDVVPLTFRQPEDATMPEEDVPDVDLDLGLTPRDR